MKLLSIIVPCYNSEGYLSATIDSLLKGGSEIEIVLVDDGSSDGTADIVDDYAGKYPDIIRGVHKENGGHGSAINRGIEEAGGLYFKVVDSDDHLSSEAFPEVINTLKRLSNGPDPLDLLICNFVYDKQGTKKKKVMQYRKALPVGRMFGWDEIHRLKTGHYILMHSVIYRTEMLRECGMKLPEHTFYVDNLFVFEPLPYVRNIFYLDVDFYYYYIGREDQSVNEQVMISRIDQQLRVNYRMVDYMSDVNARRIHRNLRRYMYSYLDIITAVSSIMLIRAKTPEALKKKRKLWRYIWKKDKAIFTRIRTSFLGNAMNMPGKGGRLVSNVVYELARRVYNFN